MQIKKIIHIADIHIRTYRFHSEYKHSFNELLDQLKILCNEFHREEIRIAIVGDLVHQKIVVSNELLLLGTWFLKELEKIAPVIIIAGNHDLLENNKDRVDSISPMVNLLSDLNINFFKETGCYLDDNVVWCVYSIFEENSTPNIQAARNQFGNDKTYVGLFHAPIINAKTDTGYIIDHGYGLEIFNGCDFVLLGDIHQRQEFIYNGIKMVYPSSLIQQNFGESVNGHGFLFWDVNEKSYIEYDVSNDYPFYTIKISSVDDVENNKEKIINL